MIGLPQQTLPPPAEAFVEMPGDDGRMIKMPKGFYQKETVESEVQYGTVHGDCLTD